MAYAQPMSDFFHPRLTGVEALAPYRLRTSWSTGETLDADLAPLLRRIPALAPLLEPDTFAKARLADNIYALDKERAGEASQMFGDWMRRNHLSLSAAALPRTLPIVQAA